MRTRIGLVWTLALFAQAPAETPAFSRPSLGTVFDESGKGFRSLSGVPGAVDAGGLFAMADSFAYACFDSRAGTGVGATKDGRAGFLRAGPVGLAVTLIDDRPDAPDRCAAAGQTAVLASRAGARIWSGLTGVPETISTYSPQTLGGMPRDVAIASDGSVVVALLDSGAVVELRDGVREIGVAGRAIAYGGRALFVLDQQGGVLRMLGADTVTLGNDIEPNSVLAADETRVAALGRDTGRVVVLSSDGARRTELESECRAARVQPLEIPGLFYVTDRDADGWILDATTNAPTLRRVSPNSGGVR